MTDLERAIYKACKNADQKFGDSGMGGTKTWIRDFFLPSLEKYGLAINLQSSGSEPAQDGDTKPDPDGK